MQSGTDPLCTVHVYEAARQKTYKQQQNDSTIVEEPNAAGVRKFPVTHMQDAVRIL